MFALLLACVTPESEADTTSVDEACITPIVVDYACHDGTSYTFPGGLPLMASLLVEYEDGTWRPKTLTIGPGRVWSVDVGADSYCGVDTAPAVVGGRLVLAYE